MKESTKNNFLLPLVVVIIGSFIISPIANAWYDPAKKTIPFVTPILRFFSFIWNNCLNYKIPIWIFLIIISVTIYVIYSVRKKSENRPLKMTFDDDITHEDMLLAVGPDYLNYKQGEFKGWQWGWEYKWDGAKKKYTIEELRPICSKCKMKSIDNISNSETICPSCDNKFDIHSTAITARNKIKALIQHKIDNKSYQ